MESFKKFLPYVLVAIIFAVGGYFIGAGNLDNQGASLYKAAPKNPPGLYSVYSSNGSCWAHYWGDFYGSADTEGVLGADGGCHFLPTGGTSGPAVISKGATDPTPAGLYGSAVYHSGGGCWEHQDGYVDVEGIEDGSGGCLFLRVNPNTGGPTPTSSKGATKATATPVKAAPVVR